MGSLAKALRRSDRLRPVGEMIAEFVNKADEEENNRKLFDLLKGTSGNIQSSFQPRENPQFGQAINNFMNEPTMATQNLPTPLGPIPANLIGRASGLATLSKIPQKKVDYNAATNESRQFISDFLMEAMKENIDPNRLKGAMDILQLQMPQKPQTKEGFSLGEGQQRIEFDESGKPIIVAENKKDYKPESPFKNFSARGYWDTSDPANPKWIENQSYKPEKTTVNVNTNDYDYSNQKGNIRSGIMLMDQIKRAQPNEAGEYVVPNISGNGFITLKNYDDVTKYKEQAKTKYAKDAIAMVEQQGLVFAKDKVKEDIDELLKKTGSKHPTEAQLNAALDKFKKDQKQFDDTDIDILRNYFQFFYM